MKMEMQSKDVIVTWMPEINAFEIKINKDTMINKETGDIDLETLYSGLDDIITCQEINSSSDYWFAYDGEIYILTDNDFKELKETGKTIMSYNGTIKENVDLDVESHREFIKWYYSADTLKEAIAAMN